MNTVQTLRIRRGWEPFKTDVLGSPVKMMLGPLSFEHAKIIHPYIGGYRNLSEFAFYGYQLQQKSQPILEAIVKDLEGMTVGGACPAAGDLALYPQFGPLVWMILIEAYVRYRGCCPGCHADLLKDLDNTTRRDGDACRCAACGYKINAKYQTVPVMAMPALEQ